MRILRSQYLKKNTENELRTCVAKGIKESVPGNRQNNMVDSFSSLRRKQANKSSNYFVGHHPISSLSSSNATNIKILIGECDETLEKLNVIVEYTDVDPLWLTRLYKTYENDFWHKEFRLTALGKKCFFHCRLCDKVYKEFMSIKSHLNGHLDFYPYVCKLCQKKYTNRKSATFHLKNAHKLKKEEWNNFLTS